MRMCVRRAIVNADSGDREHPSVAKLFHWVLPKEEDPDGGRAATDETNPRSSTTEAREGPTNPRHRPVMRRGAGDGL